MACVISIVLPLHFLDPESFAQTGPCNWDFFQYSDKSYIIYETEVLIHYELCKRILLCGLEESIQLSHDNALLQLYSSFKWKEQQNIFGEFKELKVILIYVYLIHENFPS